MTARGHDVSTHREATFGRDNPVPGEVPRRWRRSTKVAMAAGAVLAIAAIATPVQASLRVPTPGFDAPITSVVFSYHCSSSVAESDELYTITGTAPGEVVQGSELTLDDVIITGTPTVDLLLVSLTVDLVAPIGATSVDGLSRTFLGPGSTTPPGPIAPAGTPNSSPPMSFRFIASGEVGTTVDFFAGTVSSVVADIEDPSFTVPVTCTRTSGSSFASTVIVGVPPSTTTTSTTTAPTTTTTAPATTTTTPADPSGVLAAGVTPVSARPTFTG
jgi:hypothetical protein